MKMITMKRTLCSLTLSSAMMTAMAGGYLGNTNQSIGFLRNPARDASFGIDGVYYNPAGTAFLRDGLHLELNWQMVHQHRDSRANYGGLFRYNFANPATASDGSREYGGRVSVPFQPSLFALYNHNDWSYMLGFGFIGGGGDCEYGSGMGMFEALVGSKALAALGSDFGGYSADIYVRGRSYDLGLTLGAARKVNERLSLSLGLRGIGVMNNYKGHLRDIRFRTKGGMIIDKSMNPALADLELDCDQSALGIAPIIGIDYKVSQQLNIAAKYEFRTRLTTKNSAANSESFNQLAASQPSLGGYLDGVKAPADMPALLTVGVQYSPIQSLRLSAGYHRYFDVDTRQWNKSRLGDTNELTLGAEYDITPRLEVSAGGQRTIYDQTDANVSDMSFNLSSYSVGAGISYRISPKVKVNAAYFTTIYSDYTKTVPQQSVTTYSRTNQVIGVGMELEL